MVILIIISGLLFISSIILFVLARSQQIDNSQLQLQKKKLEAECGEIKNNYTILKNRYDETNYDYGILKAQETVLNNSIKEKQALADNFLNVEKQKIQEQLELFKSNSNYAMQNYISSMENTYNDVDKVFDNKVNKLKQEYDKINNEIESIRATLTAATEARLREEESKGNLDFYKLQISDIDLDDIKKLNSIKLMLHNPVVLSKLIWTTYYQKPYKAMCSRVLSDITVIGIYKITDLTTEQCYIGQSVDIAKRWSDHIKAGLGIDNNGTNKLYKAMQANGVHNFTFELLEPCERNLLDEKEKFFINLYQSDKFGLNATKGNG